MKKIIKIKKLFLASSLALIGSLVLLGIVYAQQISRIHVVNTDASQFPTITSEIRILDEFGNHIAGVTKDQIDVYESGIETPVTNFEISSNSNRPVLYMFVLDRGQYANFDEDVTKSLLRELIDGGHFREGFDEVTILERLNEGIDKTYTVLPATKDSIAFLSAIDELKLGETDKVDSILGMKDALTVGHNKSVESNARVAIFYLGRILEGISETKAGNDADAFADEAFAKNVQVYAIETNKPVNDAIERLTGGASDRYHQIQSNVNNVAIVSQMYAQVFASAQTYTVSFRSQINEAGNRQIIFVPANGTLDDASSARGDANVAFGSPKLTLVISPLGEEENVTLRKYREGQTDEAAHNMEPDLLEVTIEVEAWFYNLNFGRLALAELYVDSVLVDTLENPASEAIAFKIDISEVTENTSWPIKVKIVDEIDLTHESESRNHTIKVDNELMFNADDPAEKVCEILGNNHSECLARKNIAATATANKAAIAQLGAEKEKIGGALEESVADVERRNWMILALFSIAAIAIFFAIKFKNELRSVPDNLKSAVQKGVTAITDVFSNKNKEPLAKLHILSGEAQHEEIKIHQHKVTIGRDPDVVDVLLSMSKQVSRKHCTIQYKKSVGFTITDHGSEFGTEVNGNMLDPKAVYGLKDGSRISLGDPFLARSPGVRLRFEILQPVASIDADLADNTKINVDGDEAAQAILERRRLKKEQLKDIDRTPQNPEYGGSETNDSSSGGSWLDKLG